MRISVLNLNHRNVQKHKAIDRFVDNMPCGKRQDVSVELFEWNGNRYVFSVFVNYDTIKCRYKLDRLLRLLHRLKKV
jgi:hypothetical protein